MINGILLLGNRRLGWPHKCPVVIVLPTLLHPGPQQLLLPLCQNPLRLRWRHKIGLVIRLDPINRFTRLRIPWHNRPNPIMIRIRSLGGIQPQVRFPRLPIGSVTVIAILRKDRSNIAIEINLNGLGETSTRNDQGTCKKSDGFHGRSHPNLPTTTPL